MFDGRAPPQGERRALLLTADRGLPDEEPVVVLESVCRRRLDDQKLSPATGARPIPRRASAGISITLAFLVCLAR